MHVELFVLNLASKYEMKSCYFIKEGNRKWKGSMRKQELVSDSFSLRKYITDKCLISIFISFALEAKIRFLDQMYYYLQQGCAEAPCLSPLAAT